MFMITRQLRIGKSEDRGPVSFEPMWKETTLFTERVVQFATAKTCIFSDLVLCLGGISGEPVEAWDSRIKCLFDARYLKDLDRIDGEPMDFEWTICPGFTTFGNSRRDSKDDD